MTKIAEITKEITSMDNVAALTKKINDENKPNPQGIKEVAAPSIWELAAAGTVGMAAGTAVNMASYPVNKTIMKVLKNTKCVQAKDSRTIMSALNKALQYTGLKDKVGVMTQEGLNNGLFNPGLNAIILDEAPAFKLAAFHELGHAHNYNASKIGKFLQNMRYGNILSKWGMLTTIVAAAIPLIALLKTKKADGEEPSGAIDKATTFIKNNAGKLTFASFLPMILEEAMASMKGASYANKFLSPKFASSVKKFQGIALMTYIATAAFVGLGTWAMVKTKDFLASREVVNYDKHFDFDGDGKLNVAENKAKETYLNGRKAEKENLFKKFDFNQNGQLEDDEKAAMEAYKKAS